VDIAIQFAVKIAREAMQAGGTFNVEAQCALPRVVNGLFFFF
jgi:hypothetical protein